MQDTLKQGRIIVNVRQDVTKKQLIETFEKDIGPVDFFIELDRYGLVTIEYYGISQDLVGDINRVLDRFRRAVYENPVNTRGVVGAKSILWTLAESWPEPIYIIPGENPWELIVGSNDRSGVAYVVGEFMYQCGL